MSPSGPNSNSLSSSMARWMADGWTGRAPLRAIFWGGGSVWFFGQLIERGIIHMFLLPQSPYAVNASAALNMLIRASEWILLGIFIWWCVSVWRCAEQEPRGVWPTTAKGIVVLLVIGNAVPAFLAMTR